MRYLLTVICVVELCTFSQTVGQPSHFFAGSVFQVYENDKPIDKYVSIIAGQEVGSKKEHLQFTTKGKYRDGMALMIGDAPGDLRAAKANNLLFYPIIPGQEEASWERFHNEIIDRFFEGKYTQEFAAELIDEFNSYLPDKPAWA